MSKNTKLSALELDNTGWAFLKNPSKYFKTAVGAVDGGLSDLMELPLKRQFRTVHEILERFSHQPGVLLADDVGLGKTTVGALLALIMASQDHKVRIYAPNPVLRENWAKEIERHLPVFNAFARTEQKLTPINIVQGNGRSGKRQIRVVTHDNLVKTQESNFECDFLIIDEAHRAKGETSNFSTAVSRLTNRVKRTLILTATPFSIKLAELKQLLGFVGATKLDAVENYANALRRLYTLKEGHDLQAESQFLVEMATAAIEAIKPFVIRHGIDDLGAGEKDYFGEPGTAPWAIKVAPASPDDLSLLLRMDRLLQLAPKHKGKPRNDPRFHIGWHAVDIKLKQLNASLEAPDPILGKHIEQARSSLDQRLGIPDKRPGIPHPKIAGVIDAIQPVLAAGEKVLVFCHHHATAHEVLTEFEKASSLRRVVKGTQPASSKIKISAPVSKVWRKAWESILASSKIVAPAAGNHAKNKTGSDNDDYELALEMADDLLLPLIDWFCSPGLYAQITGWLAEAHGNDGFTLAEKSPDKLITLLESTKARNANYERVPSIAQAAVDLAKELLDPTSVSTRAVLKRLAYAQDPDHEEDHSGIAKSSIPGRLDEGYRVMGYWNSKSDSTPPKTLHRASQPDMVIALFNSPFGPDVLVTTDRLSEGVNLHRYCRHLIHYELDPSPVRTLQRNGRIRRVNSWASKTQRPICYAYPAFGGTRDERAVDIMRQRIKAFGLLLGGVPKVDEESLEVEGFFAQAVVSTAASELGKLNHRLAV